MANINTVNFTAAQNQNNNTTRSNNNDLGKDAFLELLVTQLRYQDPLEPMDDKEFISQMAEFSALEQMQNVNKQVSLLGVSLVTNQAMSLIGQEVRWMDGKEEVSGVVTGIKFTEQGPALIVGDKKIFLSDVTSIGKVPEETPEIEPENPDNSEKAVRK